MRKSYILPAIFAILTGNFIAASAQQMVLDAEPGLNCSCPQNFVTLNGVVYYSASTSAFGGELWRSDGTAGGTWMVKDIYPGSGASWPSNLVVYNNLLYFTADEGTNGGELWRSDGTDTGTYMVADIYTGPNGSWPWNLKVMNGMLYFSASDGVNGGELWKSNGTAPGTSMVKDINPGSNSSWPGNIFAYNNIILFSADDGVTATELWLSDGTDMGTVLLKDIYAVYGGSWPTGFTEYGGLVYFYATDTLYGSELWKTDGTPGGTFIVKDINPGVDGSSPQNFVIFNGEIYFTAYNSAYGNEIWKTDGTDPGTVIVQDLYPGIDGSNPSYLTLFNGSIIFSANNDGNGYEPWRFDGSIFTQISIHPTAGSDPNNFTNFSGDLYFRADNGGSGSELWKINAGFTASMVSDINPGINSSWPNNLITTGTLMMFTADNGMNGNELWKMAPPPVISFTMDNDSGCTPFTVNFTNTSQNIPPTGYFQWNFGDASSAYGFNASHTFISSSTFWVVLNLYDSVMGYIGSVQNPVYVQWGSSGSITVSPSPACPGEPITLNTPVCNQFPSTWNFGDGNFQNNSAYNCTTSHAYTTSDTFLIKFLYTTVCMADTIVDSLSASVIVSNALQPDASFNPTPATECPGTNIYFYPSVYSGTHTWDFGDTTTSGSQQPYHTYDYLGSYMAVHTLTNFCNNTGIDTQYVNIVNTIYPNNNGFSYSPSSPMCPGKQISFSSNNYGTEDKFWDFGDGFSSIGSNPKHSYTSAGNYTVNHVIVNGCGNSDTFSLMINIVDSLFPSTGFSIYPNPACPDEMINYYPSEQDGKTYFWDFGDGETTTLKNPLHAYSAAGTYSVIYSVKNFCNVIFTDTTTIDVATSRPITGNFYPNQWPSSALCPGEKFNFQSGTWGFPYYVWDMGNGFVDTSGNAYMEYGYPAAGNYSPSVTLINYCGNDTTLYFNPVSVVDSNPVPPWVSLSHWPSQVCPGQNVSFNMPWGFATYTFDMGDGSPSFTTSTCCSLNYSYAAVDTYVVALTVTNFCGNDTTVYDTVKINPNITIPPNPCCLNGWPLPACPQSVVNFNAPWGNYISFEWDFGDGTPVITTSNNQATHSYAAVGIYTVRLTLTNYCGDTETITYTAEIRDDLPIYDWLWLSAYPEIACPNQMVNCTLSTMSTYSSYEWDFGDGYTAFGSSAASHSYDSLGNYNITVTVANTCGSTATASTSVYIDSTGSFPSWMNMWYNPNPACPGERVTLETQAGYSSYFWEFGDGDTMTTNGPKANHIYGIAGKYYAKVTITSSCGNSVKLIAQINIDASTTISWFDVLVPSPSYCAGDEVMFNVSASGAGNLIYAWNFGDGTSDTTYGTGITHVYNSTGNYNVTVVATNSCGNSKSVNKSIAINNSASPTLNPWQWGSFAATNVIGCPGDAVVFYFEGVNENNTWDFGDSVTATATEVFVRENGTVVTIIKHAYASAGTFNVTLTLGNNCNNSTSGTKSFTVSSDLLPEAGLIIEPPNGTQGYTTCMGIHFVATGGSNYIFNFGDGTVDTSISPTITHSYADSGNYTVIVTITNGCGNTAVVSKPISINGVGGTTLAGSVASAPSCAGNSDGSVTVSVSGGFPPYYYQWDGPGNQTTQAATGLPAGFYSVVVTDDLGCSGIESVTLNDPPSISLSISSTPATCGLSDGTISASVVSGGTGPFTYQWSNGAVASLNDSIGLGVYIVTVTDAKGCSSNIAGGVSETGGPAITVSSVTDVLCNGQSNGAVNISVSGGTQPYSYVWSNSATTEDISSVAAGNYYVSVTDSAGCRASASATVDEAEPMSVTFSSVNTNCGTSNGESTANISGGNAPYAYQWDVIADNQTTQTATGLAAGTYEITITDANSCSVTGTATVSNNNAPNVSATITNVTCNGLTNGVIVQTVTGGTSPYNYTWSTTPAKFTKNVNNLAAGTYICIIQDASNCMIIQSYTVTQPAVLTATASASSATCGNNDGSVTVSVSGGTTTYSYIWNTGNTTSAVTGLTGGNYSVTVTDSKGCTVSASASIIVAAATEQICMVTVDPVLQKNVIVWEKTGGQSTAGFVIYKEILTNVYDSIGYAPFDSLSNFTDFASDPKTKSNRYKVSAVDSCSNESSLSSAHKTMHVTANLGIIPPPYTERNLIWEVYEGFSFGQYRIWRGTVAGNPLTLIDSVVSTTTTYSDYDTIVGADTLFYMVEVVPSFTCNATLKIKSYNSSKSNTASMEAPTQPLNATASGTDVTCSGGSTGSATANATGGDPSYTYLWSDPLSQATQTATGLGAGTYTVTVTDSKSSTTTATVTLTEPSAIVVTTTPVNSTCSASDGSASASATGGNGGFNYSWTGGQATQNATGLSAGTYTVTATDSKGCTQTATATIGSNNIPLTLNSSATDATCNGGNDGDAIATASSGTGPYSYLWDSGTGNQVSQTATGLIANTYSVTVTDAQGCSNSTIATVGEPAVIVLTISPSNASCNNPDGYASASATGGNGGFGYLWDATAGNQTTIQATGLIPGSYAVTATDYKGCTQTGTTTVGSTNVLIDITAIATDAVCNGGNDGDATVTATTGNSPYSYQWDNNAANQVTQTATGLSANIYSVTVTDANGCYNSTTATVSEPAAISINTSSNNATCNNADGDATAAATGGNGGFNYLWDSAAGSQATAQATGLTPGTYTVTATDSKGCTQSTNASVGSTNVPITVTAAATDVSCNGGNDGTATATATSGNAPYTYQWDAAALNQNVQTATGLSANSYSVTVTDAGGCYGTQSATVNEPSAISLSVTTTNSTCGNADGSATVTASGGNGGFGYVWSDGQTDQTADSISAGNYTVTVTDSKGCTASSVASVSDLNAPVLSFTSTQVTCNGDGDGTANVSATGGTPPYTYLWDAGAGNQTNSTATGLNGGNYSVVLTDNAGCIATGNISVAEPAALSLTAVISNANAPGNNDGSIDVTVSGGTGAYTYAWDNGDITEDIFNLPADTYAVTVTDANGCQLVVDTFNVKLIVGGYYHSPLTTHELLVYPNPFKGETTIGYGLVSGGMVTLEILNVLGERVALLFDGIQAAGTYKITFDTQKGSIGDGIYIAKLNVNGSIRLVRMMHLK